MGDAARAASQSLQEVVMTNVTNPKLRRSLHLSLRLTSAALFSLGIMAASANAAGHGHGGGGEHGGSFGGGHGGGHGGGGYGGGRGGWSGGYYAAPAVVFDAPYYCAPPIVYGPNYPYYDDCE
jgi:uncharacterized membrane protein